MYINNQNKKKQFNITTIFILLLSIYYIKNIIVISYYNNIIYANTLTNNRVLYIDESGKLNTTGITADELMQIKSEMESLKQHQQDMKTQLLESIYPIGSIYISVNNISPASFLGGSWTSIGAGKTLVGVDTNDTDFNTVEKTGGEKTHILTVNEMPSHNHTIAHTHTRGNMEIYGWFPTLLYPDGNNVGSNATGGGAFSRAGTKSLYMSKNDYANYNSYYYDFYASRNWTGSTSEPSNANSGNQGSGQAHNNLQPYITVYMWKRTN